MVRWAASEAEVWRKASHPQANARMFKARQCTVHHGNRSKEKAMDTRLKNKKSGCKVSLYEEGRGSHFACLSHADENAQHRISVFLTSSQHKSLDN